MKIGPITDDCFSFCEIDLVGKFRFYRNKKHAVLNSNGIQWIKSGTKLRKTHIRKDVQLVT